MSRVLFFVAAIALAPMQCGGTDDPSLRKYENPGEALYDLAQDFRAKGNEEAYQQTLRYLMARYPSSRRAVTARVELEEEARSARGQPGGATNGSSADVSGP